MPGTGIRLLLGALLTGKASIMAANYGCGRENPRGYLPWILPHTNHLLPRWWSERCAM